MCENAANSSPILAVQPSPEDPQVLDPSSAPLRRPASPMNDKTGRADRRRFPGLPNQIAHARRFVARHLDNSPEATTAALLTSELATNAIAHSASGERTGKFEIRIRLAPGWARVEVRDLGNLSRTPEPQHRDPCDTSENGRGLDLVEALASKWGSEPRRDGRGREVWFELEWSEDESA